MTCSNQKDIQKIQGDSYKRSLIFKDKNGTAINLTGSVIKFSMKSTLTDVAYIVNQSFILTDAVNGKASITVDLSMDS